MRRTIANLVGLLWLACIISSCENIQSDDVNLAEPTPFDLKEDPTQTPLPPPEKDEIPVIRPSDEINRIYISEESFQMGSTEEEVMEAIHLCNQFYSPCNHWFYERESPQHTVILNSFWIDKTEVSNTQYAQCVEVGFCDEPSACKKGLPTFNDPAKANHPVVCVDWENSQTYCQWVGGRLPTEAEWEYVSRGKAGLMYPWGNEFDGSRLNFCDTNCSQSHADTRFDDGYSLTAPVGSFLSGASWAGVLNLGGNVSEWTYDWLAAFSQETYSNPSGPETGDQKIIKGCNWFHHPAYCRGALRASTSPDTRFDFLGFRCAYDVNDK